MSKSNLDRNELLGFRLLTADQTSNVAAVPALGAKIGDKCTSIRPDRTESAVPHVNETARKRSGD